MNRYAQYIVVVLVGVLIGYFAGREHLKYEMRTAFQSAAEGLSEGILSAFGDSSDRKRVSADIVESDEPDRDELDMAKAAYIDESLELYDLSAKYIETYSGRVAGVLFKLRNNGETSLDRVEVTVYFKDGNGNVIAEEDFHPVRVSEYSIGDNKPLRPGYIWQMEQGKYYTAKQIPSEWKEGSIESSITDIRFAE